MKIEKVNDNQIRCTLTREDLADRQIKLSELAYGSEKARSLFKDMIQQANYEFGFEVNDIPLMVEAIPLSTESIILVITKVEYPEELDTRFSKFSDADDEYYDEEPVEAAANVVPPQGADDILDLFEKIRKERERLSKENNQETGSVDDKSEAEKTEEVAEAEKKEIKKPVLPEIPADITKLFEIADLDQAIRLANVISAYYQGENTLYKNEKDGKFYILLHKSEHTPAEFNKICNRVSEYARQRNYTAAVGAFFAEHGKLILEGDAIHTLASL